MKDCLSEPCGPGGRNGIMLRRHFPKVVGFDLPAMIHKYQKHVSGRERIYDAAYSDIDELLRIEDICTLYDSVAFQHIVDREYCGSLVAKLAASKKLSVVVTVFNARLQSTHLIDLLSERDWTILHKEQEALSFDGSAHTVVILMSGRLDIPGPG